MQESLSIIRAKKKALKCLKKAYEIAYYAGLSKEIKSHLIDAVNLAEKEVNSMHLAIPATIYINPDQYDYFVKTVLGSKPVQANGG